jgi:hypothetical protein
MRYLMIMTWLWCAGIAGWAAELYMRPDGGNYGAENGSDWNNAFDGCGDVAWGAGTGTVGAGDILYMAGGTYAGNLSPQTSGTGDAAGQRIIIRRATAGEHGTAAGWTGDLDTMVTMRGYINIDGRSYITVDGVTEYGIYTASASPQGIRVNNSTFITVQYVRVDGSVNEDSYIGLLIAGNSRDVLVRHCWISNTPNDNMRFLQSSDCTIEYCRIGPKIDPCDTCYGWHADMAEIRDTRGFIYRYNVHNWSADGLFFFTADSNWHIYGNVWHNGGKGMRTHSTNNAAGPIYVYNNSFFNCSAAVSFGSAAFGDFKNNIIYGLPNNAFGSVTHDYNYYNLSPSPAEAHQVAGANPFVSSAGLDFRILESSTARNAGTVLDARYTVDPAGNTRGADGTWDMGAYEYTTTGISIGNPGRAATDGLAGTRSIYDLAGRIVTTRHIQAPGIYFFRSDKKLGRIVVLK